MSRRSCLELLLNFQSMGTGQAPESRDMATEDVDRFAKHEDERVPRIERKHHAKARGSKTSLGAQPLARRHCFRRGMLDVHEVYCGQDLPGTDHQALLMA